MLTDKEFRHYQELYNDDPVVQRLCKMEFSDDLEENLEERVAELEAELDDLRWDFESIEDRNYDLEKENQQLREKIAIWETLESKNLKNDSL